MYFILYKKDKFLDLGGDSNHLKIVRILSFSCRAQYKLSRISILHTARNHHYLRSGFFSDFLETKNGDKKINKIPGYM